jgi:hypothetical protein
LIHAIISSYRVQYDDVGAHINVGRTLNHLKMYQEAEEAYLKVNNHFKKKIASIVINV